MAHISTLWLGWNHQLRIYWFTSDLFRPRIDSGYGWDFDLDFQVFFLDTRGTAAVFVLLYWSTRRDNYHQGLPRVEKEIFEIDVDARGTKGPVLSIPTCAKYVTIEYNWPLWSKGSTTHPDEIIYKGANETQNSFYTNTNFNINDSKKWQRKMNIYWMHLTLPRFTSFFDGEFG